MTRTRDRFGPKSWAFLWLIWWAGFAAIDCWRDERGNHTTFSELLRWIFHVDHWWGQVIFLIVLTAAYVIFALHIAWHKW